MILTVTLNPLLERRYIYHKAVFDTENRNGTSVLTAGGKGVNVSRQLNLFKVDNIALILIGGLNGKTLKQILIDEKLNFTSIKTESQTRDAALIISESEKKVSTFFSKNSEVSEKEAEEFKLKLSKMIQNSDIVVFSGSSPCPAADSIFPFGIETANQFDKISICDTYGNHLKECIRAKPTVIHNNVLEIERSLNFSLSTENQLLQFLDSLYDSGVKQAYITNGSMTSYASNFSFKFKIEVPVIDAIDPTGSGDAFTAAIAYGLHQSLTFEESLINAASLGVLNASRFETCKISPDEIDTVKSEIKISTIGKKIKKLDVP